MPDKRAPAVILSPTRYTSVDDVEYRYVAYIKLQHPPFTGKIPLEMYHEYGLTYHIDGVIATTTCRLILEDPVVDREVVDLTTDLDNVKMENSEENKENRRHEQRQYQGSSSPPPLEREVPFILIFLSLH